MILFVYIFSGYYFDVWLDFICLTKLNFQNCNFSKQVARIDRDCDLLKALAIFEPKCSVPMLSYNLLSVCFTNTNGSSGVNDWTFKRNLGVPFRIGLHTSFCVIIRENIYKKWSNLIRLNPLHKIIIITEPV